MAATRRPPLHTQVVVLAVAVVVALGGAVIWSRTVSSGDGDERIVLGGPTTEVDPDSVNPSVTGEEFPIVELTDADGATVRLEPDGRPMVVNLWFSTCGPCARELQYFAAVAAEFGDQVRFVGVDPHDSVDDMLEFAAARGVGYELLRDDYTLVDTLGTVYFPMTVFVSADGRVVAQTGELTDTELRQHLHELLA